MALRPVFDLDLLRTLVFIAEEGSFTRAADRVGRTQSAITLQIQKLETFVQQQLLVRSKGGRVELTPQGEILVESARRILRLNDEALDAVQSPDIPLTIRLGTSPYYTPFYLDETLVRLRTSHPNVTLEVIEGYSCQLAPRIKEDAFDLILCEGGHRPRDWTATEVWHGPLKWIISETHTAHLLDPLPLSLTPRDCPWRPAWMDDCYWRSSALQTLNKADRRYRIVATSNAKEGLYAPVLAGDAVTVSTGGSLPDGLRVAGDDAGLPPLPDSSVIIIKGRNAAHPLTDIVADAILATFTID